MRIPAVPQGTLFSTGMQSQTGDGAMSLIEESDGELVVEECMQELDELIMSLDRYPPAAVAVAMSTYLEGLLGALLDEGQCTDAEVRDLLREIESGALRAQPPATP
jgi:hypothetical protein